MLQEQLAGFDPDKQSHLEGQKDYSQVQQVDRASCMYEHDDHILDQIDKVFVVEFQRHILHTRAHMHQGLMGTLQIGMGIQQDSE